MNGERSPFVRMFVASLDFIVCSGVLPEVANRPSALAVSTISGAVKGFLVICRTS